MNPAVILVVVFVALGGFMFIAIKSWNHDGRLDATEPEKLKAADPYAEVPAVGRDEAELERDNDPVRCLEDADGGGYTPEQFGAAAARDGLI